MGLGLRIDSSIDLYLVLIPLSVREAVGEMRSIEDHSEVCGQGSVTREEEGAQVRRARRNLGRRTQWPVVPDLMSRVGEMGLK